MPTDTPVLSPISVKISKERGGYDQCHFTLSSREDTLFSSSVRFPRGVQQRFLQLLVETMQGRPGVAEVSTAANQIVLFRLDLEPGAFTARFRVFEPDFLGGVKKSHVDLTVELVAFVHAWWLALKPLGFNDAAENLGYSLGDTESIMLVSVFLFKYGVIGLDDYAFSKTDETWKKAIGQLHGVLEHLRPAKTA